jgi:hypothetical protein
MSPARAPVWGAASGDLNATVLEWPAGDGPAEHANEERDVLYVVLAGAATLTVDGEPRSFRPVRRRSWTRTHRPLAAGADGVRYLTAHVRREGLQLKRF